MDEDGRLLVIKNKRIIHEHLWVYSALYVLAEKASEFN